MVFGDLLSINFLKNGKKDTAKQFHAGILCSKLFGQLEPKNTDDVKDIGFGVPDFVIIVINNIIFKLCQIQ